MLTGREIHSTGTHHNEKWLTLLSRKKSLEKLMKKLFGKEKQGILKPVTMEMLSVIMYWEFTSIGLKNQQYDRH